MKRILLILSTIFLIASAYGQTAQLTDFAYYAEPNESQTTYYRLPDGSFSLFVAATGLAIQEPPTGKSMLTGQDQPGVFNTAPAMSVGAFYSKGLWFAYGKTSYASVYELHTMAAERNYRYVNLIGGLGIKVDYFGLGVGFTSSADLDRNRNRAGLNFIGLVDYPVRRNLSVLVLPEISIVDFSRQILTLSIGISYKLPSK